MRHPPMPPMAALALLLALPACGSDPLPSFNLSSRPDAPGDSLTIRRVMGDTTSIERVDNDTQLGWIDPEAPRTTLGNPDEAVRNIPQYQPVPRPDMDRDLRPRRGSSTSPTLFDPPAPERPLPRVSRTDPFAPPASLAPGPNRAGQSIAVPGGPPAILGAGGGGQTPYTRAGMPGGVAVDNGTGAVTLLGADGTVQVVPR